MRCLAMPIPATGADFMLGGDHVDDAAGRHDFFDYSPRLVLGSYWNSSYAGLPADSVHGVGPGFPDYTGRSRASIFSFSTNHQPEGGRWKGRKGCPEAVGGCIARLGRMGEIGEYLGDGFTDRSGVRGKVNSQGSAGDVLLASGLFPSYILSL